MTGALVMAQTVQITRTVTSSEDGLPLLGVTISVKGTTLGALSALTGKYLSQSLQVLQLLPLVILVLKHRRLQ